jgi:hypothetical protein
MALVPGVRPAIQVGGRVFTDLTNLILIYGRATTTTNSTLRKPNGSSGYTPAAGKTFTVHAVRAIVMAAAAAGCIIGYADNDIGFSSASALTNPVRIGGASHPFIAMASLTPDMNEAALGLSGAFAVPEAKYPFCESSSGDVLVHVYGYDV